MILVSDFTSIQGISKDDTQFIAIVRNPPVRTAHTYRIYKPLVPCKNKLVDLEYNRITLNEFKEYYRREVLDKLNPFDVVKDIDTHRINILLTHGRPGVFSHRQLVADWLTYHTDQAVGDYHK